MHDGWDWSKRHPVVRLDFSSGDFFDPDELPDNLTEQFDILESEYGAKSGYDRAPIRFRSLLRELHRRTGRRVVVLVDEYDKPILDAIDEPEIAELNRRRLRALYGTVKFADAHVEMTFITGVSKFSKVSLFSDLNNLIDLTLDPAYAAICGYTDADLDAVFAPELPGLDRDAIRAWYNGYHWLGEETAVQPIRPAHAVPQPRVQGALVRDGDAAVPDRHAAAARLHRPGSGERARQRDACCRRSTWRRSRRRLCCSRPAT